MPTAVFAGDKMVVPLLNKMRLPREVLLDLAAKIGGERANVGATEPPLVAGFETWRWATRFLREDETLRSLGWMYCDVDQVHGIRHPDLEIKLVALTTDANTGTDKPPRNISEKGPASRRMIARNSGQLVLFPDEDRNEEDGGLTDQLWYYCLHLSEEHVAIEISRPDSETEGMINNFSDRIIVARPGDVPGIRRTIVPEDFADLPKPKVTRK